MKTRMNNMIIKEDKVPCRVDICMSNTSYSIKVNEQCICKEHMKELLSYLQNLFNEISKDDE